MPTGRYALIIQLSLQFSSFRLLELKGSLGPHLDPRSRQEDPVQLVLSPLENVDEHWEVLAEAAQSEHIIPGIPLAIRDKVQHTALIGLVRHHFFHRCVPDARFAVLRA